MEIRVFPNKEMSPRDSGKLLGMEGSGWVSGGAKMSSTSWSYRRELLHHVNNTVVVLSTNRNTIF